MFIIVLWELYVIKGLFQFIDSSKLVFGYFAASSSDMWLESFLHCVKLEYYVDICMISNTKPKLNIN